MNKMAKVFFVGIHNKPGKMPLCSSTMSGKMIDRIIKKAGIKDWQKTNLCDCDYFPPEEEIVSYSTDYTLRINYNDWDLFILLGRFVHENFPRMPNTKKIHIAHPASLMGTVKKDSYILNTAKLINENL